jgi:hypothetical protein
VIQPPPSTMSECDFMTDDEGRATGARN